MNTGARTVLRWAVRHGTVRIGIAAAALRGDAQARFYTNPSTLDDPYPFFRQVRDEADLVPGGIFWCTGRHAVTLELMHNDAFVVANNRKQNGPRICAPLHRFGQSGAPVGPVDAPAMLAVDPPVHTRYRRLVSKVFSRRAIDALEAGVEEHCGRLLDQMHGRVDLVESYAYPLPLAVIGDILGVPPAMQPQILAWSKAIAPALDLGLSLTVFRRLERAVRESNAWMLAHFERVRRDPGDDLISQLVRPDADGYRLTDEELLATAGLLLNAGFETTAGLLSMGTELFIRHPEQLDLLRADPELWPNAIEEILRYDTPIQNASRICAAPTHVAGVALRPGDMVVAMLGGANRDPAVFPDPDRFDVTRANAREHVAFAAGRHHCLGAALARLEGRIALRALFSRYPRIKLAGAPTRRPTRVLRGYRTLPVDLGVRDVLGRVSLKHKHPVEV
jgi:cytochrome P450